MNAGRSRSGCGSWESDKSVACQNEGDPNYDRMMLCGGGDKKRVVWATPFGMATHLSHLVPLLYHHESLLLLFPLPAALLLDYEWCDPRSVSPCIDPIQGQSQEGRYPPMAHSLPMATTESCE